MRDKIIKTILTALPIVLLIAMVWFSIDSRIQSNRDSKRATELKKRAVKYEKLYTETDQLYSETVGTLERTELELENLREAHRRAGELAAELEAENQRLERTISELGSLHSELAEGTGRAEELIGAIDAEARRALESVERLQAGSGGTD